MFERDAGRCYLLFPRCRSIHTFFMRLPIDVIFLDGQSRIVAIHPAVRPWRMLAGPRTATATLELPAGTASAHRAAVGERFQ